MSNIGSNGSARSVAATHGSARSVAATHGSARSVAATHDSVRSVAENSVVKPEPRKKSFIQLFINGSAALRKQFSSVSEGSKKAKIDLDQMNIKVVKDEYDPRNSGIVKIALPSVKLTSAKDQTTLRDNESIKFQHTQIKERREEQEFNNFFPNNNEVKPQADQDDSFSEYTENDRWGQDLDANYNDNSTETTVENNCDISSTKADAGSSV